LIACQTAKAFTPISAMVPALSMSRYEVVKVVSTWPSMMLPFCSVV
jgi:hypothetical protein